MTTYSFRPGEETDAEIRALRSTRPSSSAVFRDAVHRLYVEEQYERAQAEAQAIMADPAERAEIAAVQEEMNDLRAW